VEDFLISIQDDPDIVEEADYAADMVAFPLNKAGCRGLIPGGWDYTHAIIHVPMGGCEQISHLPIGILPATDLESRLTALQHKGLELTTTNLEIYDSGFNDKPHNIEHLLDPSQADSLWEEDPQDYGNAKEEGADLAYQQRQVRLDNLTDFLRFIRQCGDQGKTPALVYDLKKGWRFKHKLLNQITKPRYFENLPQTTTIVTHQPQNLTHLHVKELDVRAVTLCSAERNVVGASILPIIKHTKSQFLAGASVTVESTPNVGPLLQAAWAYIWSARARYEAPSAGRVVHWRRNQELTYIPLKKHQPWLSERDMKLLRQAFRILLKHFHLPETTLNLHERPSPVYQEKLQGQLAELKQEEESLLTKKFHTLADINRLADLPEVIDNTQRLLDDAILHRLYLGGWTPDFLGFDVREADSNHEWGKAPGTVYFKTQLMWMRSDIHDLRSQLD
jgi:hypothetical protein